MIRNCLLVVSSISIGIGRVKKRELSPVLEADQDPHHQSNTLGNIFRAERTSDYDTTFLDILRYHK